MTSFKSELAYGKQYERKIAELWLGKVMPGAQLVEIVGRSQLDFMVIRDDEAVCLLEIKKRRIASTDFETIIFDYEKHNAARFAITSLKMPTYAIVAYNDTVAEWRLDEAPDGTEVIKRWDRYGSGKPHALYRVERAVLHPDLAEKLAETEVNV